MLDTHIAPKLGAFFSGKPGSARGDGGEAARPLLIISAGFDAHLADPLAELRWSDDDYRWLGAWIRGQAEAFCEGCCVAVMEGGYDTAALAASVRAFCAGYADDRAVIPDAPSASDRQ